MSYHRRKKKKNKTKPRQRKKGREGGREEKKKLMSFESIPLAMVMIAWYMGIKDYYKMVY